MRLLKKSIHTSLQSLEGQSIIQRPSARAIVLRGSQILLLYTQRYHDYSLPGGGIDEEETPKQALVRELSEETGAHTITNIKEFGIYEEYRPWYKPDCDIQHIISYCYTCEVGDQLGQTEYEDYEVNNGMKPIWIDIKEAIAHNRETMAKSEKKGMSIERETFLLELIAKELI